MRLDIIIKKIKEKIQASRDRKNNERLFEIFKHNIKRKVKENSDEGIREILRKVELELSARDANRMIDILNLNYYGIYKVDRRFSVR